MLREFKLSCSEAERDQDVEIAYLVPTTRSKNHSIVNFFLNSFSIARRIASSMIPLIPPLFHVRLAQFTVGSEMNGSMGDGFL